MRVLIGCECSGVVRDAFRVRGHEAWSCDIKPCDGDSTFHLRGDILSILGAEKWDLGIFHPECRYLCSSGLHWNKRRPERAELTEKSFCFVMKLHSKAKIYCDRHVIENSIGCLSTRWMKPTQIIQPYNFGENASKSTALWLFGVPKLTPTQYVEPEYGCKCGHRFSLDLGKYGCPNCEGGKGAARFVWGNQTPTGQNKLGPSANRSALRARTYPGIADAMASQWGEINAEMVGSRNEDSADSLVNDALYSARYILEELNHENGYKMMADATGLPTGVIVSAFDNIFNTPDSVRSSADPIVKGGNSLTINQLP